ncbi:MAG: EAL domain-containing protein [Acidimicrobiales bacterium]|nr:EAL domain-containing protein [Acidimicrobiales bacterium]
MQAPHLFLLHVAFFASIPVVLAARRRPLSVPLLYAYLAVTLFIGGFLSSLYQFPLMGDVVVGPGSVAHAAFLFTSLVLVVTTRDIVVLRDVIKLALMTTVFKIAFILLATRSLRSADVANPFATSPELFDASLRTVLAGSILIVIELVLLVAFLERSKKARDRFSSAVLYPVALTAVLVLDGLAFPILIDPGGSDLLEVIRLGVLGKLIVAGAFCVPVLIYYAVFRERVRLYEAEPIPMRGLLRTTSVELVREIERQERELEYQATHDGLTGLFNRAEMLRQIDDALGHRGLGRRRCLAVMFIDLDDFKVVNDAHGHAAGDAALIAISRRIRSCLRDGDVAARLGGDEFTVLIKNVIDAETATRVASRILERLAEPLPIHLDSTAAIHASIGITFADEDFDGSAEVLIRNADLAMYRAKELGKDGFEVFTEDLHRRAQHRAELATEIHAGISGGEFVTLYQPQVELTTGKLLGVEALVRWVHPRRGLLAPGEFIEQAESSSAIVEMGAQVLDRACEDAAEWIRWNDQPLELSVNVSARQLRDPILLPQVTTALARSGLDPSLLTLEITESSLMSDVHESVRSVEQLRDLGVKISIDDFGTGFSSLAYLHMLPVDTLKIDKSFIDRICDRRVTSGGPLVASIIGLGNLLGLSVIAEGVENDQQCTALVDLGCHIGQGFHFSPAVSADEITALMATDHLQPCGTPTPALVEG